MKTAGTPQPLIDGVEKVTGRARYTADLPAAHALVGDILRSPIAHGEIVRIDTSRARALPGVRAVLTGEDCDVAYGILPIAHNETCAAGSSGPRCWSISAACRGWMRFPGPRQAARSAPVSVAAPTHRASATLGGNLCLDTRCVYYNQSEGWRRSNGYCLKRGGEICHVAPRGKVCHAAFSGDVAPALLALGATLELASPAGGRTIPVAELYRDDGAAHLALAPGEFIVRVRVPRPALGVRAAYRKVRLRGSIDFPLAGVAVALACASGRLEELRIALTGTNPRPLLLSGTEELVGKQVDDSVLAKVGKLVQKQASPVRTTLAQANYRRQVAAVTARRLVKELAAC